MIVETIPEPMLWMVYFIVGLLGSIFIMVTYHYVKFRIGEFIGKNSRDRGEIKATA